MNTTKTTDTWHMPTQFYYHCDLILPNGMRTNIDTFEHLVTMGIFCYDDLGTRIHVA